MATPGCRASSAAVKSRPCRRRDSHGREVPLRTERTTRALGLGRWVAAPDDSRDADPVGFEGVVVRERGRRDARLRLEAREKRVLERRHFFGAVVDLLRNVDRNDQDARRPEADVDAGKAAEAPGDEARGDDEKGSERDLGEDEERERPARAPGSGRGPARRAEIFLDRATRGVEGGRHPEENAGADREQQGIADRRGRESDVRKPRNSQGARDAAGAGATSRRGRGRRPHRPRRAAGSRRRAGEDPRARTARAARIASSRRRVSERAKSRFATLTQAMRNTNRTAVPRRSRRGRTTPLPPRPRASGPSRPRRGWRHPPGASAAGSPRSRFRRGSGLLRAPGGRALRARNCAGSEARSRRRERGPRKDVSGCERDRRRRRGHGGKEAPGHHADDDAGTPVEDDRSPENRGIRGESLPPEPLRDQDDGRRPADRVFTAEGAPETRRHAEKVEEGVVDAGSRELHRLAGARERQARSAERRDPPAMTLRSARSRHATNDLAATRAPSPWPPSSISQTATSSVGER